MTQQVGWGMRWEPRAYSEQSIIRTDCSDQLKYTYIDRSRLCVETCNTNIFGTRNNTPIASKTTTPTSHSLNPKIVLASFILV